MVLPREGWSSPGLFAPRHTMHEWILFYFSTEIGGGNWSVAQLNCNPTTTPSLGTDDDDDGAKRAEDA